ncbi:alpha-ribazole phosphatase [Tenacibaculum sp. MAR_2009_124]|uniref:alpha-ribazole phosphatase family protein n=1 Tax=Tenacibaculum sp. MAR_2009_124 TaxID=1250059 RepID=UPI0008976F3E|nr:alpha-ribazole phosphatase family protein [Tenacibaculum sp. MAR_2009_124]SEB54894.1 alpha-ribazole phosphatase [Tenacibaculum sp. MAR_2009_124]
MEVILIRHTTPKIDKGVCYGQSDIDVEDSFEEEVIIIKDTLGEIDDNDILYSSPLKRCTLLAKKLSKNIIFDDRLKELNFGSWELKRWNDIDKEILDVWMNDFVNITPTNGESYINMFGRTSNFLRELKNKGIKKAIIVTHAGVIRSINAFVNDIPLKDSFNLEVPYGAIIKLNV